jgi:hypothetical protein
MSGIFGKLKSGAGNVAHKAEKVAHIRRIEGDINNIKKQIDEQYHKIGEMTYKSKVNNQPENSEVAGMISRITNLFEQISFKEEEIKKVNEEPE